MLCLISLVLRQAVDIVTLEDAIHGGITDDQIMVTLKIHADAPGAEMVVLTQVKNLLDDLRSGGDGALMRRRGTVAQAGFAILLVAFEPAIEDGATDAKVTAGLGDVASLCGLVDDLEAPCL